MSDFLVLAHTTEDGQTSEHFTIAEAKKAANKRTGRGGVWARTTLSDGVTRVWEKGERDDRDLFAIVFSAAPHVRAQVADSFGLDSTEPTMGDPTLFPPRE